MEKTEGHDSGWGGIDSDHVRKIIPESLYLFISIILGGIDGLGTWAVKIQEQVSYIVKLCGNTT